MKLDRLVQWFSISASVLFSAAVLAAGPVAYINSGSDTRVGTSAEVRGGNFPPRSSIKIVITPPFGAASTQTVATDADGKLSTSVQLTERGRFQVVAQNAQGAELAKTLVMAR